MSDVLHQRQMDLASGEREVQYQEDKMASFGWKCVQISTSALSGVVFGFAVEKGRVFEPAVIRDQMLFARFVMLKMFLAAAATSMFTFSMFAMVPVTRPHLSRAIRAFSAGFDNKGVLSSALGGTILGIGMTLSGSCPGMVYAQIGAGVGSAFITLSGGVCGVLLYGMLETAVVRTTKPQSPFTPHYLHQLWRSTLYHNALPCAAILGIVVFGLELYAPWTSEVPTGGQTLYSSVSWPPFVSGILLGLLQIPTVLFVSDTLGSSSSMCTLVSQVFRVPPLRGLCPYLSKFQSGLDNWWQLLFMGGVVMGAHLSSTLSGSAGHTPGVSPGEAFLGGMLILFGSRLAAGCTSGHGLSGMGLMSLLSFITVPCMFAGGISTAVIMKGL